MNAFSDTNPNDSADTRPTPQKKLREMLVAFEKAHSESSDHPGKDLAKLIKASPQLREDILASIARGNLEKFDTLVDSGASYSSYSKTLHISVDDLKKAKADKLSANDMTFSLGQEVNRSLNKDAIDKDRDKFISEAIKIASSSTEHDYTHTLTARMRAVRDHESESVIGGFNALAARVGKGKPWVDLETLYEADPERMSDFIARTENGSKFHYAMKDGLSLNEENKVTRSPRNIEAIGQHHFDKFAGHAKLGSNADQDYTNYYGKEAIEDIKRIEKIVQERGLPASEIRLDTAALGFDKDMVESSLKFTDTSDRASGFGLSMSESDKDRFSEKYLRKILAEFSEAHDQPGQTPGMNLRDILEDEPHLRKECYEAIEKKELRKFDILPADSHSGADQNGTKDTIRFRAEHLNSKSNQLIWNIGHEIKHAQNDPTISKAHSDFATEAKGIASSPGPHDYTEALKHYLASHRESEARAEIGGFNAIVAHVKKDNPNADLDDLYKALPWRMSHYIDRSGTEPNFDYSLKPGVMLEADMTMKDSSNNIEAVGKYYFDTPANQTRLGALGNQDYTNHYAEDALKSIAKIETKQLERMRETDPSAVMPEIRLNFKELRLDPKQIDIPVHFKDSSHEILTSPRQGKPVDDTPHREAQGPEKPPKAAPMLYTQALHALEPLQGRIGINSQDELENLSASSAAQAKKAKMTSIDGAYVGKDDCVIVHQGNPASESVHRIAVNVTQGKQQPAGPLLASLAPEPQTVAVHQPHQRSMNM
jgi:hypothetical protein